MVLRVRTDAPTPICPLRMRSIMPMTPAKLLARAARRIQSTYKSRNVVYPLGRFLLIELLENLIPIKLRPKLVRHTGTPDSIMNPGCQKSISCVDGPDA